MSQSESIELVGAKELEKILLSLDAKVARKLSSKALRAGAKIIQAEAASLAPVKSGALRNAIKVRAGKNKKGFRSIKVAIGEKWFVGDQFYAAFIEMGWKTGPRRGKIARQFAAVKRGASRLRKESRLAGGLAKTGSSFRNKQEAYFMREGQTYAAGLKYRNRHQPRREIPGIHFMEKAAHNKMNQAVAAVTDTLRELANTAISA